MLILFSQKIIYQIINSNEVVLVLWHELCTFVYDIYLERSTYQIRFEIQVKDRWKLLNVKLDVKLWGKGFEYRIHFWLEPKIFFSLCFSRLVIPSVLSVIFLKILRKFSFYHLSQKCLFKVYLMFFRFFAILTRRCDSAPKRGL